MNYSIIEIANVLNVDVNKLRDKDAIVSHLLTDSRSLTYAQQTLFFALRTHNNDGHNYITALYEQGVRNFVVRLDYQAPASLRDANLLAVSNPLDALQALATYHRRRFREIPVIGITGSRGKTAVKEWLFQLLNADYHIVRSPRSYNSQIGVPLSIWELDELTTMAIIEAGISTTGEMDNLQMMIRPTIGIITNIGSEHNDGFASMEEKASEKAKILNSCESIVYCADDDLVTSTIKPLLEVDVAHEVSWSRNDARRPLFVRQVQQQGQSTAIEYVYKDETSSFTIPFTSPRDVENAITCLAVLLDLGIARETIAARMAKLAPVGTRINVIEGVNNCTLIADGYTSDYNSLTPALDFMMRRVGTRGSTIILSDLQPDVYEGDELYIRVSELLKGKNVQQLIGIGPDMCRYSRYFGGMKTRFFDTTAQMLYEMTQGDFEGETILIKGAPEFEFDQIVDMLEAKQHQTVEEIDLSALVHNFHLFKSRINTTTRTVAMVKASGYGTGSYEVAKTLQDAGADYLAVAVQDEGVDLRKAGITMPIIVLNPSVVNYKSMFRYGLEPEVYSINELQRLVREGERYGARDHAVHIKIDTGMHRLGFTLEQLPELLSELKRQHVLRVSSIFSHLCAADEPALDRYTQQQFDTFDRACAVLQEGLGYPVMRHILNTAGIVRFPEHQYEMVRIGVGLYGIRTVDEGESELQTVATLRSVIISIKEWPAGTTIGYGCKGLLKRNSRIATVSIGYADGLDRHLGNGAIDVWAGGKRCPIVGNVCMDAVMVDITDTDCQVGDTVEIFGPHISIDEVASVRGTIAYEVLTSVSPRVKRVYYRE